MTKKQLKKEVIDAYWNTSKSVKEIAEHYGIGDSIPTYWSTKEGKPTDKTNNQEAIFVVDARHAAIIAYILNEHQIRFQCPKKFELTMELESEINNESVL